MTVAEASEATYTWPLPLPPLPEQPRDGWVDDALCLDHPNPDPIWFTDTEAASDRPPPECLEICSTCPVRGDCLMTAILDREPNGHWAGTTKRERSRIAAELGLPKPRWNRP